MDENIFFDTNGSRTTKEVREAFFRFFQSKGHYISRPMPIVNLNADGIQFTNAGIDQFKDILLSQTAIKSITLVNSQPCLHISFEGEDLDDRHHSMFEMLGNWSFGDYFKKETIAWAWELLTDVYKIEKDRLYVTIFEGNKSLGLESDDESFEDWLNYLPENHIIYGNMETNFPQISGTPFFSSASAIWYDNRPGNERNQFAGAKIVNTSHPQVIELWNLTFIEYMSKNDQLFSLKPNYVDTGMGLERLVSIIQGKYSNYDTDLFSDLIKCITKLQGIAYTGALQSIDRALSAALRIVADHTRAVVFILADTVLLSKGETDSLVNKYMRNTLVIAYQQLKVNQPFLHHLVPIIAQQFKGVFNKLWEQKDIIEQIVWEKETEILKAILA